MGFKSPKLVILNFYAQTMPRRFLVDTTHIYICMCCVKQLAITVRLSIFIHADILVMVSELVVVAILSEWQSVPTTVGTSLGVPKLSQQQHVLHTGYAKHSFLICLTNAMQLNLFLYNGPHKLYSLRIQPCKIYKKSYQGILCSYTPVYIPSIQP